MRRIAGELRILKNDEDKKAVFQHQITYVNHEKDGVYEHNGKMYEYFATFLYIDYFVEVIKPLEVGVKINKWK